jgi:radical SAM-linked protein
VNGFINVRVFFSKSGNAKYISHLDLYRAMGRAVKRARLPVWITEGFNPHIYMTFALPLALGIEGGEESMDLRLTENPPVADLSGFSEVAARLNAVMPQGLEVIRVAEPVHKANEIKKARYEIQADEMQILDEYFMQPEITVIKKTKKTTRTIDIKPLIEWDCGVLTLPSGNEFNINPWNVLNALEGQCASNVLCDFQIGNIKRTAILCGNGESFV